MVEVIEWILKSYILSSLHSHLRLVRSKIDTAQDLRSIRALKHHYYEVASLRARLLTGWVHPNECPCDTEVTHIAGFECRYSFQVS